MVTLKVKLAGQENVFPEKKPLEHLVILGYTKKKHKLKYIYNYMLFRLQPIFH